MRERGWGRILYTSSVAAFTGGSIGPHYAASKAGLHGLLHFVAAREAANGVTANALAPALIADTAILPGDPAELAKRIPVGPPRHAGRGRRPRALGPAQRLPVEPGDRDRRRDAPALSVIP